MVARAGLDGRIELVSSAVFAAVPPGADRYLLSAVVHDWPASIKQGPSNGLMSQLALGCHPASSG